MSGTRPVRLKTSEKATAGFEPAIGVLQTLALPLGYVAPLLSAHFTLFYHVPRSRQIDAPASASAAIIYGRVITSAPGGG